MRKSKLKTELVRQKVEGLLESLPRLRLRLSLSTMEEEGTWKQAFGNGFSDEEIVTSRECSFSLTPLILVRVHKSLDPFNHPPPCLHPPIRPPEAQRRARHNEDHQHMARDTDPNGSHIPRRLPVENDVRAGDPAEPVTRRHGRSDGGALPLSGDVIRQVGVQCGPVADVRACGEVRAYVADCDLGWETEHTESYDEAEGVEDYDWAAETVFVPDIGG